MRILKKRINCPDCGREYEPHMNGCGGGQVDKLAGRRAVKDRVEADKHDKKTAQFKADQARQHQRAKMKNVGKLFREEPPGAAVPAGHRVMKIKGGYTIVEGER